MYIFVIVLFRFVLGCCLLPFFLKFFKDVYHSCPKCHRVLHVDKKQCCWPRPQLQKYNNKTRRRRRKNTKTQHTYHHHLVNMIVHEHEISWWTLWHTLPKKKKTLTMYYDDDDDVMIRILQHATAIHNLSILPSFRHPQTETFWFCRDLRFRVLKFDESMVFAQFSDVQCS